MATYAVLLNWTDQGVANASGTLKRAADATALLKQMGGKLKDIYWTIGPYDALCIAEAPDDETITAFSLAVSTQGNVRTTTLRAFDRREMGAILSRLGG